MAWLAGTIVPAQARPFADVASDARQCGVLPDTVDRIEAEIDSGALADADGAGLLEPLIAACRQKFPTRPFEEKLEEGLTKRVMPMRIVQALNRKLDDYGKARVLLEGKPEADSAEALVVIGEGLTKGAPRQDFESYISEFSGRPADLFLTGAEMTSLLGQVEFEYGLTRTILQSGFDAKTLTPHWRFLVRLILVARQRGLDDGAIAQAAAEVLAMDGSLNDVASRLGFTGRDLSGRTNSN